MLETIFMMLIYEKKIQSKTLSANPEKRNYKSDSIEVKNFY